MTRSPPTPVERLLKDSDDDAIDPEAQALEAALLPLQGPIKAQPAPDLWDRIASEIDKNAAAPGTTTIAPDEGVWESIGNGIERKVVHVDRAKNTQSYFIRMAAGSVLPGHEHAADEHCVVLAGALQIGGAVYGEGTYHFARDGIPHVPITAHSDALFFIHGAL